MYHQKFRSFGGNLVFVDEGALVPRKSLDEGIWPLMRNKHASIAIVSTPKGSDNVLSEYTEKRGASGRKIFNTVNASSTCPECTAKGLRKTCRHRLYMEGEWMDESVERLIQAVVSGSQQKFNNEMLGMITTESGGVFNMDLLQKMRKAKRASKDAGFTIPHLIFISVDPGDASSDTAAVVHCFDNKKGTFVVRIIMYVCSCLPPHGLHRRHGSARRCQYRPSPPRSPH